MAKAKKLIVGESMTTPVSETRTWPQAHGTYISGQAYIDEADKLAAAMEVKWGDRKSVV